MFYLKRQNDKTYQVINVDFCLLQDRPYLCLQCQTLTERATPVVMSEKSTYICN